MASARRAPLVVLATLVTLAACSRAAPPAEKSPPGRRYGDAMAEIGRRFELAGRAAEAGRFELARFEIGELDEVFDDDLPRAELPREGAEGVDLRALARTFAETHVKALERAAASRDARAFAEAWRRAATDCNGCHAATKHGFLEVPLAPGASVPALDRVGPDAGADK